VPKRIAANGIELAYEDTGDSGPAVVFVHGLGGSTRAWDAQLFACEDRFRGIAYDQRGHGASEKPKGPYSIEQWSADLIGLLDGLGIGEAAIVGHSVGCMVAAETAAELGERVWALALCGGTPSWSAEGQQALTERAELARAGKMAEIAETVTTSGLSERCRQDRADIQRRMRELIEANDAKAYAEAATATAAGSMDGLERIESPVLSFSGSEDPVTPPREAAAIAARCQRGEAEVIPGAAHWCMLENPEAFNRLVFGFLERKAP
jgi:pimeloyl-ACP methyl ester carboxylesterase